MHLLTSYFSPYAKQTSPFPPFRCTLEYAFGNLEQLDGL